MALGTNHVGITDATGTDAGFVPEIWQDDVIVPYKANIILAERVKHIDHMGKKGDTIWLPSLTDRGSASAKAEDTQVTLVARTDAEIGILLNKHYEYSFVVEDIVALQALDSLRREYTDDAGYALAKKVDQDLFIAFAAMQGGAQYSGAVIGSDGTTAWDGTANTNTGNAAALTDAGIRAVIQTLDDQDNPMTGRHLVIPPVERNNIMGLSRFTEQAFVGEAGRMSTIRNGILGNVYGVDIAITTNCPWVHTDSGDGDDFFDFSSAAAVTGTDATGASVTIGAGGVAYGRVAVMFHREAVVHAEQMGVRTQTQYKQEYLGDLFTADTVYGVSECRDYGAVPIIVAN